MPFAVWPAQVSALESMHRHRLTLILKARQLGLSWLAIGYALWQMIFHPAAAILIFSQRDEEAIDLLARLRGIYDRLPPFLQAASTSLDNKHEFSLANGSSAKSFPTTAGRSYTGSLVIVDEADYLPDLQQLLNAVKPTIDAGGRMLLISTADKGQPESTFKRIYRAARKSENEWHTLFLPWHARPQRDAGWYDRISRDIFSRTGSLDDLYQEYPASDTEALAPRSLDKRISPMWIEACFAETDPLGQEAATPPIVNLEIYVYPERGRRYVIGGDPAEGNPNSDDSTALVLDMQTGEECAVLAGKFEPAILASYILLLSEYYNGAPAMIERNNHGHAVLQWMEENAGWVRLLFGHDEKMGWMSSKLGKTLLYTECADHFRSNAETFTKVLHSYATYSQLASIDGSTLRAPEGMHDDRADAFALAQVGRISVGLHETIMRQAPVRGRGGNPMVRSSYAAKESPIRVKSPLQKQEEQR
jgi:hypothetical protein